MNNRMRLTSVSIVMVWAVALAPCAAAADADGDSIGRLGVTIWGLSYHINRSIDYEANNWGAGLRYYLSRHLFIEGDALRNSNRGIVLPVSLGGQLRVASIAGTCDVSAMAALTVAFYQNVRTNRDYVKWGPVPGVSVRCGHFQPNAIVVLSPSNQLVAAVAASLTIRF